MDSPNADAPVVTKKGSAVSWKTTVAGIIAALGLVGEQLQEGWPTGAAGWLNLLLKAFGPVALGWFARDANVSSEGRRVVPQVEHDSRS